MSDVVNRDSPQSVSGPSQGPRRVGSPNHARRWVNILPTISWAIGRTGRGGLIGIALIATAAVFMMSTYQPMRADVEASRAELVSARAAVVKNSASPRSGENSDARGFLDSLPDRSEVPRLLGVLITQAEHAGLSIDSAKYDVSIQRSGGMTRYNVTFPVSGPYPAVRVFIDSVVKELPNAAITELSVERKTIADGGVDANVRLSFYVRNAR